MLCIYLLFLNDRTCVIDGSCVCVSLFFCVIDILVHACFMFVQYEYPLGCVLHGLMLYNVVYLCYALRSCVVDVVLYVLCCFVCCVVCFFAVEMRLVNKVFLCVVDVLLSFGLVSALCWLFVCVVCVCCICRVLCNRLLWVFMICFV